MTKTMRKITAIMLSVLLCCSAVTSLPVTTFASETNSAVGATSGITRDCTWTFDEATSTLTIRGNGKMRNYNIADDYVFISEAPWKTLSIKKAVIENGVTNIGKEAFNGCTGLTSVTIPDSVTSIGYAAFSGCTGLTSVNIGNGVTSIGVRAFNGCMKLTSITIPNSVTWIDSEAFYGCKGLINVTIGNNVKSIGELVFRGCSRLTNVTIPNSLTNINNGAFKDCTGLTNITIPNSVTSIGNNAFYNCPGLTSVTIPNSVKSIGESAFYNCLGLTRVTIPNSVTSIGESAFNNCLGLTIFGHTYSTAQLYAKTNQIPFVSIAKWTYNKETCTLSFSGTGTTGYDYPWRAYPVKEIIIEEGMTEIYAGAFEGLTDLTKISIPDTVTSIGEKAFYGCEKLKTVTVPKSVTTIGEKAFGYYIGEYYNNDLDYGTKEMNVDSFTMIGAQNSAANEYAEKNGLVFVSPIKGDINCDGKVNGADAGLLNRYISGWEGYEDKIKSMQCADINGDGKVQGNDAGLLNRYCSGWTGYDKYIQTVTK